MKSLEHLRADHDLILVALERTEQALRARDDDAIAACIEFFGTFVEGIHQEKEENILFPAVSGRFHDMIRGTLDALSKEHFVARAYLRAADRTFGPATLGDDSARATLAHSLQSYVGLMRAHLIKENEMFFRFVESASDKLDDEGMLEGMIAVQDEIVDAPTLERLLALGRRPTKRTPPATFLDARTLTDDSAPEQHQEETVIEARAGACLFDDGRHQNIWLHDFGRGLAVQANQFLIVDEGEGMVLDPGGPKVYADVYAETMLRLRGGSLRYVFLSHQDPDIGTSLNAWLMDTKATAYTSKLWVRFLPHFGIDRLLEDRLVGVPDEGCTLQLGRSELLILPAHFLHSPGNLHVYDPRSKVLFSGDLGASLATHSSVVTDFDEHTKSMLGFHRRYIPTSAALRAWVKMARQLDIETIAPQHGAIFQGRDMVNRFLHWCENIECGMDVLEDLFRLPGERTMITRVRQ